MSGKTLAFGASGKFAGIVVSALSSRGLKVRGFVREDAEGRMATANGAEEVAVGDLTDRSSIECALRGIDRVFYIAPAFLPGEADVDRQVVDACVGAGVERFVFSSVIHPVLSGLSNHAAKTPVEEALIDSGMDYTILHPSLYFQNYLQSWPKILEIGTIAEPWSCDTRFSRVDFRGVAEVIAFVEERLLQGSFELCSDSWLDRHDVAALISAALGREISAARIDPSTLGKDAAPMRPMFEHYDRTSLLGSPLTLRAILGREPRTLRAFFEELAFNREAS